ncbi:MAG: aspartyl/asparaginyl beta-hydroxylase domain-containing protein [Pseudomonadota bacterium]|nr:aspartyl/asparaginyl beta-hydroxylase domain-containing protein [Pseudomonadota bacterium]
MRVQQPFLQLPVRFCADTLAAEVHALPQSAWEPHPTGFIGNEAVRLISAIDSPNDAFDGPMAPTDHLLRCPYIMEVMAELGGTWGRSRLMGLAPGADVPVHVDIHYYWRTHLRIHIPIITNPGVSFTCDDDTVHMAAGECWVFDSFRRHGVRNLGDARRVHLVLDTVGSAHHWDLVEEAQQGLAATNGMRFLPPGQRPGEPLAFEQVNSPYIMSPWEIRAHITYLVDQTLAHPRLDGIMKRLDRFVCSWSTAWARYGMNDDGLVTYRQLLAEIRADLKSGDGGDILLTNGRTLYFALNQLILVNALSRRAAQADAGDSDDAAERRMAS